MNMNSLSTLTAKDLNSAQKRGGDFQVCPAGMHNAKVLSFTEEENYNYVSLEIDGKKYNFFFNLQLRDSDAYDADVINWLIKLATIPVTPDTSLIAITNSSIGHTYAIETYQYTPTKGKNAGKPQHGIRFSTEPAIIAATIEEEEFNQSDLPF